MNNVNNAIFDKFFENNVAEFDRGTQKEGKNFKFQLYVRLSDTGDILEVKAKKKGNCFTRFFREAWHKHNGLTCVRDLEDGVIKIQKFADDMIYKMERGLRPRLKCEDLTRRNADIVSNIGQVSGQSKIGTSFETGMKQILALQNELNLNLAEKERIKKSPDALTDNENATLMNWKEKTYEALSRFIAFHAAPVVVPSALPSLMDAGNFEEDLQAALQDDENQAEHQQLQSEQRSEPINIPITGSAHSHRESSASQSSVLSSGSSLSSSSAGIHTAAKTTRNSGSFSQPSNISITHHENTSNSYSHAVTANVTESPRPRAQRAFSASQTDFKNCKIYADKASKAASEALQAADQAKTHGKAALQIAMSGGAVHETLALMEDEISKAQKFAELANKHALNAKEKANSYGSRAVHWSDEAEQAAANATKVVTETRDFATANEKQVWKIYSEKFEERRVEGLERLRQAQEQEENRLKQASLLLPSGALPDHFQVRS